MATTNYQKASARQAQVGWLTIARNFAKASRVELPDVGVSVSLPPEAAVVGVEGLTLLRASWTPTLSPDGPGVDLEPLA